MRSKFFVLMLSYFFVCAPVYAEKAPEGMAYIPPGKITIGINKKQIRYIVSKLNGTQKYHESAMPPHSIDVKGFFIDIYEVTNKQYADFLNSVKKHEENDKKWIDFNGVAEEGDEKCRISLDNGAYKVEKGFEDHPVIFVSWYGADAYAKKLGKRLPTEAEWEKAARGEKGLLFPWGDKYEEGYSNCYKFGPKKTTAVGKFNLNNKSPYGVYDMAGNVLEWTASEYLPYPGSKYEDEFFSGKGYGLRYVARGGSWFVEDDECVTTKRFRYNPAGTFEDVGFRCAKDGE